MQEHCDEHEIEQSRPWVYLTSRMTPKADSRPAPTSRLGTRSRRRRAIIDSTTPTRTASTSSADEAHGDAPAVPASSTGMTMRHEQQPVREQLDRRAVQDQREGRPAVVEHHDLVDHRQLEMRVRIVEGDAAVLGEQHDEERDRREPERRRAELHSPRQRRPEHVGERERARELHQHEQSEEQRGLRQAREGRLASRAHALEGRARVERRGRP